MRFLFVSGGSGGHLAPLLAVGEELLKLSPGAEILYCCADQESDRAFLAAHGVKYASLAWPRRALSSPGGMLRNLAQSRIAFEMSKPDAVFSKGGSVSLPSCMLAWTQKIPLVLHESDAVWGRANKLAMKFANKICLGFPREGSADPRAEVTGNPIRQSVTRGQQSKGLRIAGLDGNKPVLLIVGGSQGAQVLNEIVASRLDELLETCDIIHLTGKGKAVSARRPGYYATEFATDELPHLYAASTIALSRCGAGTIAELAACGIPMLLVPLRGVAQDHQQANALSAQKTGGCVVLDQETLADTLLPSLHASLEPSMLAEAETRVRALHHPDAAARIAHIVLESAKKRRR